LNAVDPTLQAVLADARLRVRRKRATEATRARTSALAVAACLMISGALIALRGIASSPDPSAVSVPLPGAEPPLVEPQRLLPIAPTDARMLNATQPIVQGVLQAEPPFHFAGSPASRLRAIDCLAAAAWYEAGDDRSGERAVIQTILNRVRHPAFPATVCGVVFQGSERPSGCQFTFTCDGSMAARKPSEAAWAHARDLSEAALGGAVDKSIGQATHYHADYVIPYWRESLDKIAQVGPHIFYRWKGYWGSLAAIRRPTGLDEPAVTKLALLSAAHNSAVPVMAQPETSQAAPVPAPVAVAPLPAPIALPGISQRSTRGTLVRGEASNLFFIQIDPAAFPGTYAIAALAICKGRPQCTVLGWRDPAMMAVAAPLTDEQSHALSFYYHRDGRGEQALWNCSQVDRPSSSQCMPAERTTLAGLQSQAVPFPNS
jgi:spore germination cell wall hydrolase CwlJ-like protein